MFSFLSRIKFFGSQTLYLCSLKRQLSIWPDFWVRCFRPMSSSTFFIVISFCSRYTFNNKYVFYWVFIRYSLVPSCFILKLVKERIQKTLKNLISYLPIQLRWASGRHRISKLWLVTYRVVSFSLNLSNVHCNFLLSISDRVFVRSK